MRLSRILRLVPLLMLTYLSACGTNGVQRYGYKVLQRYPHDPNAYCQGLLFDGGFLYESTGREATSSLRKVELKTGKVLQRVDLPASLFGEGMALHGDEFFQITWKNGKGHVFDRDFKPLRQFHYDDEGWGLTSDGTYLIMSNGSSKLTFRDPATFKTVRTLNVHLNKSPLDQLNELEYINDAIWATVWKQDQIVRIDPKTGEITGIIDLTGIFPDEKRVEDDAVLNGIAYDPKAKRIFVTGKYWDTLFEIELNPL